METKKENYRHRRAADCFRHARESIPKIEKGMSTFLLTRGQFSLVDAILAILDDVGPASLSIWTWAVAEYDMQLLQRLARDGRVKSGLLMLSLAAGQTRPWLNAALAEWIETFGPDSLKYISNHAKIVTLETEAFKILLHGSLNLNYNLRYEQMQIEEGHPGFALVRATELATPALGLHPTEEECRYISGISDRVDGANYKTLRMEGLKTWKR